MKTKNIFLGIFSLMTFAIYAQNEKSEKVGTKTAVTELKVKTENLEELKNFDWNKVKEVFQGNDTEQEITLVFAYVNTSEPNNQKVRLNNFEMKLTGKTTEIDNLTARLEKSFNKLDEIDGLSIHN